MDTNDAPAADVAVAEGPGSLEADRALHDAARAGDAAAVRNRKARTSAATGPRAVRV